LRNSIQFKVSNMTSHDAGEFTLYINNHYNEANVNEFVMFAEELLESSLNDEVQQFSTAHRFEIALSAWQNFNRRAANVNYVEFKTAKHGTARDSFSSLQIISDDKPFIVDSITELLVAHGCKITTCLHPLISTVLSQSGKLSAGVDQASFSSVIYIELSTQLDAQLCATLRLKILALLNDVAAVTNDWPLMMKQARNINNAHKNQELANEINEFLQWLCLGNFTFLGYCSTNVTISSATDTEKLGLFSILTTDTSLQNSQLQLIEQETHAFISAESPLLISKSRSKSNIHRRDYYDQISVKEYANNGDVMRVHKFIGLFTQAANQLNPAQIPYLKFKLDIALQHSTLKPNGHMYKKFKHILEALPKREIFESNAENLFALAKGIFTLNAQSTCGTFIRENKFNQQVSVLVFVSKDAFSTDLRDELEALLCNAFNGQILSRRSMLNDNYLAQWHFTLVNDVKFNETVNIEELKANIEAKIQSWPESLNAAILHKWGDSTGAKLINKYVSGFSKSYRERFSPDTAITDIACFEQLNVQSKHQFNIYRNEQDADNLLRLNIYPKDQGIALSDSIPIFENFGFRPLDEFSFSVLNKNNGLQGNDLYTYTLEYPNFNQLPANGLDSEQLKSNLEQALSEVWQQHIENDGYNRLLLSANLDIRQIVIIRAYGKYLRQLGLGYSEEYFQQALLAYPQIVNELITLFDNRFALDERTIAQKKSSEVSIKARLTDRLNAVVKIDHDRILSNFVEAICATVRTNFYQNCAAGKVKPYCSFKIRSGEIEDAPQPRPYVETFVYSPRVEGVHLRFSNVSRGGLRWSDRQEDFRTEVLGLVKAQQVKNVVIVPQGAKGGFVPKQLPENGSRDDITTEAIACYKIFISALLDITDNNSSQGIEKPKQVICFDDDDPYLVVAADKGTATFSDIANSISHDYGFWLGDAFASGGSVGYDHKKMGITAKGAWVSVQRHFREMGIDVQKDEITAMGIGDMSGDVFGNGMLLSNKIKLVAAFDHRDIFIDPNPDCATSFKERQRLYDLPRSSWQDYNRSLMSKGGEVFSRSVKSITLTAEIKTLLAIDAQVVSLSPNELITRILTSNTDLLWFGGIGTYVKATSEINSDVGDKNNDALRINGNQLRCKVIGEGGNLGCSQLARIEFAKAGGRINTDAVDNSAGVNCSDNEVNIKILLNRLVDQQKLNQSQRDALLAEMTDDVAQMVLRNNYYQAQALSLDEANSHSHFDSFTRLTHYLVNSVQLNREIEYLPDNDELKTRSINKQGLTRPELAVLMAYSKMDVNNSLLEQDTLLDDAYFRRYLLSAFPATLGDNYAVDIVEHPLAKPIIATAVANEIFNRGGIHAVREQTGATIAEIVKAFIVTKEIFKLDSIWQKIESLAETVSAQIQIKMMIEVQRFYRLMAIWFINHSNSDDSIQHIIDKYSPGIRVLQQQNDADVTLPFMPITQSLYQLDSGEKCRELVDEIHQLKVSSVVFCDIIKTSYELNLNVEQVLPTYQQLSQYISISWLLEQTEKIPTSDHWSRIALFSLLLDILELREKLVVHIAHIYPQHSLAVAIDEWAATKTSDLNRITRVMADLKSTSELNIDKLCFAIRQLRTLLS